MASKLYYLYNASGSEIALDDIGYTIGAGENIEIDSNDIDDDLYQVGGDLEAAINAGDIVLSLDSNTPPATQFTPVRALQILSLESFAVDVVFDNSSNSFAANNVQAAIEEASTGGTASSPLFFDAYTTSEDNITAGWTDVPLNVEREKDTSSFTHATDSPEVTVVQSFRYLVIARVGIFQNGGNSRSNAQFRLSLDTGGGFNPIPGTLADIYSRLNAQGEGNGVVATVLDLNVGDKIKIEAQRESGGGTIFLKSEACSLTIVQPRGEKGEKGDQGDEGPQGPQGDSGEAFRIDETSDIDEAKITDVENNSGATVDDVYWIVVQNDNRSNQSLPAGIAGDMTGHLIQWDGTNWFDQGQFTGVQGPQGPQGDPGEDAQIDIEEDGILVGSGTVTTLNFTGDPVDVTETSPGEFDVALQSRISIKNNDALVTDTPHSILNFKGEDVESIVSTGNQVDITITSGFVSYIKNIIQNTIEIEGLRNSNVGDIYSYFVDTFEDGGEIDPSATNFFVDTNLGAVSLNPGGNFSVIETTEAQFNLGTFNNTETIVQQGGNGSVRKEELVAGAIILLEDFESISNITNETTGTLTIAQASPPFVVEGSFSLAATLDFSGDSTTETATFEIDLGAGGVDISADKFVNLYYLKQKEGVYTLQLEFEDEIGATYTAPEQTLEASSSYQKYQLETTALNAAIDETQLRYVRVSLLEQAAGQIIVQVIGQLDNDHLELHDGDSLKQTFIVTENTVCQRILIRVRWENSQPAGALNVAVANIFETTLGVASLQPEDASGTFTEYVLTFDNPFNLTVGNVYSVLFQTQAAQINAWDIHYDADETYTDGQLFYNGNSRADSLHFTLYTPAITEKIYFDQLEYEAESAYEVTGDFTSQAINLGLTPNALDDLSWTEDGTTDDVEIRVRVATTQGGLTAAAWSAWFTNPAGNDLGTITPQQWIQYQIRWINGTSADSNLVRDVTITYSVTPGTGSATVISTAETTGAVPETFVMLWEDTKGTGSINYSISRDGKATWQNVLEIQNGERQTFTSGSGTTVHLRAIITGNAKLFSWGVACDQEFI